MKIKLLTIGAAIAILAAFTHYAWASCGCVVSVAANKCPVDYTSAPTWWQLKDRYGNTKTWTTYNVPVPVSGGDKVTVMWGFNDWGYHRERIRRLYRLARKISERPCLDL